MVENGVYLLDVAGCAWKKLSGPGPWPQNLYEMTALAHDSRRDQLILHGGGPQRDELWTFGLNSGRWTRLEPELETPDGFPPACRREAVYFPGEDALFTCGAPADDEENVGVYVYRVEENTWRRVEIPAPPGREMWEWPARTGRWPTIPGAIWC